MPSFVCDECQATLKKAKVPSHSWQCSSFRFSCIDCGESFTGSSAAAHLSCISEAEKYQGSLYRGQRTKQPTHQPHASSAAAAPVQLTTAAALASASAATAAGSAPTTADSGNGRPPKKANKRSREQLKPSTSSDEAQVEEQAAAEETTVTVAEATSAALDHVWPSSLSWRELRKEVAQRCGVPVDQVEEELWDALHSQRTRLRIARRTRHQQLEQAT